MKKERKDELPILFNREMMIAFMAGRKTQTRRFPLAQPFKIQSGSWDCNGSIFPELDILKQTWPQMPHLSRYGGIGTDLYIRETWRADDYYPEQTIYQADFDDGRILQTKGIIKWKPSIHMPKERSRFSIRIGRKRLERLQDITAEDVLAEGVGHGFRSGARHMTSAAIDHETWIRNMRRCFQLLWDRLAPDGFDWESNPFVEVLEFPAYTVESEL